MHSPIEGTFFEASETEKKVGNKFGSNEKLLNFAPALEVKKKLAEESKFFEEMERKKVA